MGCEKDEHLGEGSLRKVVLILPLHSEVEETEERGKAKHRDWRGDEVEAASDEGEG